MEKKRAIVFLNEAMQEVYVLETLPHNNNEYPTWYQTIEGVLFKVFGKDSIEYKTFKEAGKIWGLVEDAKTEYLKALRSREAALASIIKTHKILGDEEHAVKTEPKDTAGLPVYLFDRMQFHPRVITSSKSLFETGHYSQAIFEAFKAVNNFVKEKSGLSLDGKDLMAKVFREEDPIIKLNKLKTKSERDEQDGFKFLYMGAMVGIRNPKAHDNVVQTDPYRTLEYLGFASLLMKRVEEGITVKQRPPRAHWNREKFLTDAKIRCNPERVETMEKLIDFTKSNSDTDILWGTGAKFGSFVFQKLFNNTAVSIFQVWTDGTFFLHFGPLKNRDVGIDLLNQFRLNINKIPGVTISENVIKEKSKYGSLGLNSLIRPENLKLFQDAVISLCQQLDLKGAKT